MFGMGGSIPTMNMSGAGIGGSYLSGGDGRMGGYKLSGGGMDVMGTLSQNNQDMNDYWKNPLATSFGGTGGNPYMD